MRLQSANEKRTRALFAAKTHLETAIRTLTDAPYVWETAGVRESREAINAIEAALTAKQDEVPT